MPKVEPDLRNSLNVNYQYSMVFYLMLFEISGIKH